MVLLLRRESPSGKDENHDDDTRIKRQRLKHSGVEPEKMRNCNGLSNIKHNKSYETIMNYGHKWKIMGHEWNANMTGMYSHANGSIPLRLSM